MYYAAERLNMSEQPSTRSNSLVSAETKITAVFVILALVSVYGTTAVTDTQWIHFAVLLGVGIIAPTFINEWRN
ncbi:putative membrane protein [Halapricum desulfuricans]|uniref:Putative membrane protein n=2 Tax=Halapricum desulfuricans TaxID=2841257 RepID=A0A897MY97_9EURY|nr:putative membrane protein [Halapricum desulfuricans]